MTVISARPVRRAIALSATIATIAIGVLAAPAAQAAGDPATTLAAGPAAPAASTSKLGPVPTSVKVDVKLTVDLVVTPTDPIGFTGGTGQLLIDGKPSGDPVPVVPVAGATSATVTLPVPTGKVGTYQLSATFTSAQDSPASTTAASPLTVLPATLPWTLVDENGDPITAPLTSPSVTARATGQLPGATVHAETLVKGRWDDNKGRDSAKVGADGTVEIPIVVPQQNTLGGVDATKAQTFKVRLVAASPVDKTTLTSGTKTITVPGLKVPVELQVDPGPYRADEGVDNAVRVTISWFGEDFVAGPADIADLLDSGDLTLYLDRKAVDPQDVEVASADDQTAILTFAAPSTGGDHTVQAVLDATDPNVYSASKVGHFAVAPSTFAVALLNKNGDEVTAVHGGQKLEAVAAGLLPGTKVKFVLQSKPTTLGSGTADADGIAAVPVTIPAGITAGKHTLVATATDVLGDEHVEKVALTAVVEVAATSAPTPTPSAAPGGELAATGSSTQPMVLLGTLLLLAGAGLVLARRRRA